MMVCLAMSMDCVFGFAVGSSSLISPRRNLVSGVTLRHGAVSRVAFGGMRMDGSSGEKDDKDDELLMASLRKRMPVAAEDEKFKLPTADQMVCASLCHSSKTIHSCCGQQSMALEKES